MFSGSENFHLPTDSKLNYLKISELTSYKPRRRENLSKVNQVSTKRSYQS